MMLLKSNDQECPECGCNDAERAGRVMMWGRPRQRFRCTHCGHEYSVEEKPQDPMTQGRGEHIPYYVMTCPNCESDDITVTRTVRPVRYHKCRTCNFNFSSIETRHPKSK